MRFFILSLGLFFLVAVPSVTLAGNATFFGPIVPECPSFGGATDICRACDLVKLADNIIKFMIAFSVFVAALLFAWAGFLYVTAAATPNNIQTAKTIFFNVFIGLIFVLAAWLIVDLVLRGISNQSLNVLSNIQCIDYQNNVGGIPVNSGVRPSTTTPSGGTYVPPAGNCAPMTSGPCSTENLTPAFGANAARMSTICRRESGGNPLTGTNSRCTDKLWDGGQCFSVGLFQNNLTTNVIYCPNGQSLDCRQAFTPPTDPNATRQMTFGGRPFTARAGAGWGFKIKDQTLYDQCVRLATDPGCSIETAKRKLANRPDFGDWQLARDACLVNQ